MRNTLSPVIHETHRPSSKPLLSWAIIFFFLSVVTIVPELFLAIVFLSLALVSFCVTGGMQVDEQNKRIRYFKRLSKHTWGAWRSLQQTMLVELTRSKQKQDIGSRADEILAGSTIHVSSYNLIIVGPSGERDEWHEFIDYEHARNTLFLVQKYLKIPCKDRIQEARAIAFAKGGTRRR